MIEKLSVLGRYRRNSPIKKKKKIHFSFDFCIGLNNIEVTFCLLYEISFYPAEIVMINIKKT